MKTFFRLDFLTDMNQIVENSRIYNGGDDIYTKSAERLYQIVADRFTENEDKLSRLEKAINPLLDDNSMVRLNHVIKTILETKIQVMPESWPFTKPVNRKTLKGYYDMITHPMDLEAIMQKATSKTYRTREEFLNDINLIRNNSAQYNGIDSPFTEKAQVLVDVTAEALAPFDEELAEMEANIREVETKALEDIEVDSLGNSMGGEEIAPPPAKRKRGRPRKIKTPISQEFVDVGGSDDDEKPKSISLGSTGGSVRNVSETGNLADDLQYSSEDDDPDNEDWMAVADNEEEEDVTITIEEQTPIPEQGSGGGFFQEFEAGGQSVQIEAPHIVYQGEEAANIEVSETVEEEQVVDESYDPTDFLHSLGQQQNFANTGSANNVVEAVVEMPEIVSVGPGAEVIAEGPIDVINDDLDISDSDEDEEQPQLPPPPPQALELVNETGGEQQQQSSSEADHLEVDERTVVAPPAPSLIPEPPPPDEDGLWF